MTSAIVDAILGTLSGVEPTSFQTSVHVPNSDRTLQTTRHMIGVDGTLTGVEVVTVAGSPQMDLYVKVTLEDDQDIERSTLFRGYIDGSSTPNGNGAIPIKGTWRLKLESWGYVSNVNLVLRGTILSKKREAGGWTGTDESSLERGKIRNFVGTNPAAGNEAEESVPTGARWELIGVTQRFVASAEASNRKIGLALNTNDPSTFIFIAGQATITASTEIRPLYYRWGYSDETTKIGNFIRQTLPNALTMGAGEQINTSTTGLKSGDDYIAPLIKVIDKIEIG